MPLQIQGLDPQSLSILFKAAQEGNPAAKQVLSGEGQAAFNQGQSISPPPTAAQVNAGPQVPPAPAQPMGSPVATELSPESLAKAESSTPSSAPTGSMGLTSVGMPTNQGSQMGRQALGHTVGVLLGSGLARLLSGKKAGSDFARGYGGVALPDLQRKQQEESARTQKIWSDQWEQAQQLPSEVLTDPKFAELRDAVMAMQKDMETGNVANTKTAGNFMMARAKFKDELDKIQARLAVDKEVERANLLSEAQHADNMKKMREALNMVEDTTGMVKPEEKMAAAAFLANQVRPREVVDPKTGQTVTRYLTEEQYNAWNFKLQEADRQRKALEFDERKLKSDEEYRRGALANERRGLDIREQEVQQRQGTLDSRRAGVAALGAVEAAVNNRVAAMENDPNLAALPAGQRKAVAFQKVLGDSVMQRQLLEAAGVQYGKTPDGRPAILLNGRVIPFDPRNPAANLQVMESIYGQVLSNSRLGE